MYYLHFTILTCLIAQSLAYVTPFSHKNFKRQSATAGINATNIVTNATTNANFDYVIVGGGTAGLVLAERLTENPNITVAVIEAGTFYQVTDPIVASVPAGDAAFIGSDPLDANPLYDWNFVTQPQAGANGRQVHYARGMCLGGSSAVHLMVYQRGTVGSFSEWARLTGDNSYTWDNFLPWYKKSVAFTPPQTPPRATNASAQYNAGAFTSGAGPLQVSYPHYAAPWSSWMAGALNEIGVKPIQDLNSGKLIGAQYCSTTINPTQQVRDSSQTSFLNIANGRANLKVYTLTMAKKVLFNASKKATGVLVTTAGVPYTLSARREVIISAGTFQSPQMLMVSGVGPSAILQKYGIPVIKDLPGVGQGMQDHVFFAPSYRVKVDTFTKLANDPAYLAAQLAGPYGLQRQGPLTNPGADYLGWEKIPSSLRSKFSTSAQNDLAKFPSDWPEVEYLSAPIFYGNFSIPLLNQPKDGYQYASIAAAVVAPLSRGNVTIVSADTAIKPLINPNWMTSTTDQQVAVAAYKRLRAAFASNSMKPVLIGPEYYPGAAVQTDAQILDSIRNNLMTVWHASCTCRMGQASDSMAVVDSRARVFGVTGLRVVDASAFALLPPGHPQSTIYALAEKIAADILSNA